MTRIKMMVMLEILAMATRVSVWCESKISQLNKLK